MKKIILWGFYVICLVCSETAMAQDGKDRKGDMRREQMMEKRAERLADELELKGDARSEFLVTYKNYQQDLMSHRKTPPFPADLGGKKESELTEEEAAERIKAEFDRKAQQIVDAYNTLEVDKKYYELFSKTMSAKQLMKKTGANPDDIDLVVVATTTPDYHFPSTASILCDKLGLKNAFAFDLQAACSGFLYLMETAANFIRSGRYKKIIIVGADKMSSMVNYTDRATCPIFGDGAAAFMVEPTTEDYGIMDSILRTDGKGLPFLHMKAGGSVCPPSYFTVDNKMHYLHQEGRTVFKYAVSSMSDVSAAIAEKNGLTKDNIDWIVPHQANVRIIEAVAHRMEVPMDKVLVNIEHYGNTSAATLPLCIWDFEDKLKKGDNIIFTAFGAGFTWGAVYVKWGYDGKKES